MPKIITKLTYTFKLKCGKQHQSKCKRDEIKFTQLHCKVCELCKSSEIAHSFSTIDTDIR